MSPDESTDYDPTRCPPCRGTGKVISNLGGEPKEIACPWCGGSGEFTPPSDSPERADEPAVSPS